jgi:hypothetical protein
MVVVGIGEKINKNLKKRSHGCCCGIDHLAIGGGTEQQLAMAIVANAFNSDHPKQTMVLPEGSCGERIWV